MYLKRPSPLIETISSDLSAYEWDIIHLEFTKTFSASTYLTALPLDRLKTAEISASMRIDITLIRLMYPVSEIAVSKQFSMLTAIFV